MKKLISVILALVCAMSLAAASLANFGLSADEDDETEGTVAHWKFQNSKGCYSGNIEDDDLTIVDLTGNGNDLVSAFVGNGDKLSIFEWDEGNTEGASTSGSSLKFKNTKAAAASVDEFPSDKTSWTGGYTSGKFFQTVENAPINSMNFMDGFTFEVIFKISPEFNNDYNRYTGIFSRQGVLSEQNEPPFSIAVSELSDGTTLSDGGTVGLQYIHIDGEGNKTNEEFADGRTADEWIHVMVTSDGYGITEVYVDGEAVEYLSEISEIFVTDTSYRWEVGVGRKDGTSHVDVDSENENYAEGMIRRLFCGSISEIRVMNKYITIDESLYNEAVTYDVEKDTVIDDKPVETDDGNAETEEPKQTEKPAVTTAAEGDAETSEKQNNYYVIAVCVAVGALLIVAAIIYARSRRNKK